MNQANDVLREFLGEDVVVLTTTLTATTSAEGELLELPVIVEGNLVDYSEDWVLVALPGSGRPKAVNRDHVVSIELYDETMDSLLDPNRPEIKDMN